MYRNYMFTSPGRPRFTKVLLWTRGLDQDLGDLDQDGGSQRTKYCTFRSVHGNGAWSSQDFLQETLNWEAQCLVARIPAKP